MRKFQVLCFFTQLNHSSLQKVELDAVTDWMMMAKKLIAVANILNEL